MLNADDPMRDPLTRRLLALAAVRLSAGYTVVQDEDQANRWTRLAFVLNAPPTEAMADA